MANDRVFLRCKTCGESRLFFKFWGGGEIGPLFQHPDPQPPKQPETEARVDAAQAWVEEHLRDCRKAFGMGLDGDAGFTLETESKAGPGTED